MRKLALLATVALLALVAATAARGTSSVQPLGCKKGDLDLVSDGKLTFGTDNPAFPPWFGGGEVKGSKWKINDPSTGKGFESAVAYAVADKLGFAKGDVTWIYVPFSRSFAPGPKQFDVDINQISFTPARAKVVDFSNSYYDVNQAVVVKNGTPIADATSKDELKDYKLGAQLGTTSYQYIKDEIA